MQPMAMSQIVPQLIENSRSFPVGATLVVVTAYMPTALVGVIDTLKRYGYRLVVLYLGDGFCPSLPEGVMVNNLQDHFERMDQASE